VTLGGGSCANTLQIGAYGLAPDNWAALRPDHPVFERGLQDSAAVGARAGGTPSRGTLSYLGSLSKPWRGFCSWEGNVDTCAAPRLSFRLCRHEREVPPIPRHGPKTTSVILARRSHSVERSASYPSSRQRKRLPGGGHGRSWWGNETVWSVRSRSHLAETGFLGLVAHPAFARWAGSEGGGKTLSLAGIGTTGAGTAVWFAREPPRDAGRRMME
jgi:hypothetical protein